MGRQLRLWEVTSEERQAVAQLALLRTAAAWSVERARRVRSEVSG